MSIDLKKLENKLDEALSNETNETLTKFLTDKRMSNNKQSSDLTLDLGGMTARQYAVLILRDDLKYSWQRCGNKMDITRYAARELYKRAKQKCE